MKTYIWQTVFAFSFILSLVAESTPQASTPFVAKWRGNHTAAVSFTFDDGIRDQYELAFPKMKELGIKGTFFLNGGPIENQKPTRQGAPRMTWEMVKEMSDAGMEMSNHGLNHANHGRSSREAVEVDIASNDVLIARHTGKKPITYAYPNNAKNGEWSAAVVNPGRVGSRTRQQSFGGKSGPYGHKFFKKAKQEGGWLVLMTHAIAKGYDQWRDPEVFYRLLADAAHDKDLWVATFAEASIYERMRNETKVSVVRTEKGWHVSVTPPALDKNLFAGTLDLVLADGTIHSFDPFAGDFDLVDAVSSPRQNGGDRPLLTRRDSASTVGSVAVGASSQTFEIGESEFFLNGQPFVIRCGEMHYARVPRAYWQHRLKMLRAMGCNAVGCYMFWNFHEREKGVYNWEGRADAAAFCRLAQAEGLWVILRPGPYSCAEWEGGGAPWWLMGEGGKSKSKVEAEERNDSTLQLGLKTSTLIRMRSSDPRWLEPAKRWIAEVGRQLAPLQITKGGPILMVQVENEYGLHGNDADYIRQLREATLAAGFEVPLYACNPPRVMQNGFIPELFQAANFGAEPEARFAVLRQYQKKGPLMCAEFYPAWFDTWGQAHHPPKSDREFFSPIDWMLDHRASFSLYMAHGGTSFGGWAGCRNPFVPNTTSYDYESPISEQGRANPSYAKFRERAAQHLNPGETIPEPPAPIPVKSYGAIAMAPSGGVEQLVTRTVALDEPVYMEQLGQGFGLVSYEREIGADDSGALSVDEVHDFGYVFLDGVYLGTLDRRHRGLKVTIQSAVGRAGSMSPPDSPTSRRRLVILLEAMGRINSSQGMEDRKGLSGHVRLGGKTLTGGWQAKLMPLDPDGWGRELKSKVEVEERIDKLHSSTSTQNFDSPMLYRGSLTVSGTPADTYLDMRGWKKGIVWVNGHNLGRYWAIGPQQTLYVPGCWLKDGANEVVILDFFDLRSRASQTTQTLLTRDTPILSELHPELDFNRHERTKDVPAADQIVATGEFKNTDEAQVVMFAKPVTSDVFKFSITKTYDKKNLASVGEFDLLDEKGNPLTALGLTVAGVSSEEEIRVDGAAENAIDGQVEACWMTSSRNLPHWVAFKSAAPATIGGFRYTPNPRNVGRIASWSFSIAKQQAISERPRVGGFWGEQYKMLTCRWLPHCIRQMEADGEGQEMTNFTGSKFHGCKWSDAYPYNVVEAASLALEIDPGEDAEWRKGQDFLRQKIDEWIPLFLAVQEPDGYIDNYTRLRKAPHYRNTGDHEFYVMGYFIEMGLAHFRMTGGKDRRLFDAAIRCADHLDATFGPPPKRTWMNGHPGLELALLRLAEATGEKRYADLAKWFVLHQHTQKENQSGYNQADTPAVEMSEACGHAVRANYFYTAMAEIDETKPAAKRLFESIVDRKMYLTGGIGSDYRKEAYGADYDLPQFAYAESCAGCGLAFFARAMAPWADREKAEAVYERVLYNNILGAIARDGQSFYYQNPLASNKRRTSWHGCPCCVGNVPRTLFALKDHIARIEDGVLYIDHYMDVEGLKLKSKVEVEERMKKIHSSTSTSNFDFFTLTMRTDYPRSGKVEIVTDFKGKILARFPNRCESKLYRAEPEVAHGYREVGRSFELPMPRQKVTADARVASCRGRVAYQQGPLVMSVEKKAELPNYARLNAPNVFSEVWRWEDPLALANLPRPLLAGFHPDPSVCRGKDGAYYLVTSTFLWNPGLTIYRSSDFRQWSLVGHALPDVKTLPIDEGVTEDDGVWAPTIRYHEGTYYLVFTWSSGKRKINYLSTARDPAGPWSAPRAVACPDNAGIDPSLFFDDDGKVYWQANRMIPDAKKEWRGQTMCYVQEIDLKEAKLVGERHDVSSGLARGSSHCEGPHLYKFGKKCYILAHAEGGTGRDHAETVKVSENVFGPYRPIRTNPVLTRRDRKDVPGLQCAGHVDFVRSGKNDYLAVFLGHRAYGADCRRLLGRETFACPVLWRDGDLIVKDQELVAGEFVTPEPECTIALPDANVRLRRVREIAFDETVSLVPGESAVLYRSRKLNLVWPWEDVESKVKGVGVGGGEKAVDVRLVSKDGLTVQAFVGKTPIGEPRDLSILCRGGKGANFNGLGVGAHAP